MTKNTILIELWEKTSKDLQQIHNLYNYGYYNKNEIKLYYDIIN